MQNNHLPQVIVFFDIDGVLADFDRHLDAHGLRGADGNPRWNELKRTWWSSMPAIPGAAAFFTKVADVVPATRFLTAPTLSADCFAGKADWVQTFLPHEGKGALKRLIIAAGVDKVYISGPGRILIDDRQGNINAWTAAGGIGILFKGDFKDLERQLAQYIPALQPPKKSGGIAPPRLRGH